MNVSTEVKRTLVKSPPELWSELSDPQSLARHLGDLEEVRITHSEPESMLDWEAEGATGSVRLQPSGFGTKVVLSLTRELAQAEATVELGGKAEAPEPPAPPEPPAVEAEALIVEAQMSAAEPESTKSAQERKLGFFARLFRRRRAELDGAIVSGASPEPDRTIVAAADREPEPTVEAVEPLSEDVTGVIAEPQDAPDVSGDLAMLEAEMEEQDAALLTAALDRLGAAHHRPFSRA